MRTPLHRTSLLGKRPRQILESASWPARVAGLQRSRSLESLTPWAQPPHSAQKATGVASRPLAATAAAAHNLCPYSLAWWPSCKSFGGASGHGARSAAFLCWRHTTHLVTPFQVSQRCVAWRRRCSSCLAALAACRCRLLLSPQPGSSLCARPSGHRLGCQLSRCQRSIPFKLDLPLLVA